MKTENFNGKTAILYARASKQEQSTKVQIAQLEKFCKSNGVKVINKFEENISGAAEHREKLENILYSEPMADLLIIREVSRLSREENHNEGYSKLQTLLNKYSIYILLDDLFLERGKPDLVQDIVMLIKLFGAADERKKIKERTNEAIKKYRENSPINVVAGSKVKPFGLLKVSNPNYQKGVNTKSIYIPDETEWGTVLQIWKYRAEGYSAKKISGIMNLPLYNVRIAYDSKVIRYYVEQQDKALYDAAIEAVKKNNRVPSPHKRENKYKGKIFDKDTNFAFCHKWSVSRGSQFSAKCCTSGTIKESLIDEVVIRTIRCMLTFFDLKKEELSKGNNERLKAIQTQISGLNETIQSNAKEMENLNRKYIKAPTEAAELLIIKEIEKLDKEQTTIKNQIALLKAEQKRLREIDYSGMKLNINSNNLKPLIDKYIKRIECWKIKDRWMTIKVFVNEAYIPDNFYNYKQYEVYTWLKPEITPKHIPNAVNTAYYPSKGTNRSFSIEEIGDLAGGGYFWDVKVLSIPYYTPEQLEKLYGIKK